MPTAPYGNGNTHTVWTTDAERADADEPVEHLRRTPACRSARSATPATSRSTRRCTPPTATGCSSSRSTSTPARRCSPTTVDDHEAAVAQLAGLVHASSPRTRRTASDRTRRAARLAVLGHADRALEVARAAPRRLRACSGSTGRTTPSRSTARGLAEFLGALRRIVARAVADDAAQAATCCRCSTSATGAPSSPAPPTPAARRRTAARLQHRRRRHRARARREGVDALERRASSAPARPRHPRSSRWPSSARARVEVVARRPEAVAAARRARRGASASTSTVAPLAELPRIDRSPRHRSRRCPASADRRTPRADALAARGGCCSTSSTASGRPPRARVGARRRHGRHGLGMLLHQALLQVRIFVAGDPDARAARRGRRARRHAPRRSDAPVGG